MEAHNQQPSDQQPLEPAGVNTSSSVSSVVSPVRPSRRHDSRVSSHRTLKAFALIFFCFVAGALGSFIVIYARGEFQTINNTTTRQVVSSEGDLIADIVKEVGQSTVSITTESSNAGNYFGEESVQQGAGTGIIISADGYVLTNKHVIPEGTQTVKVIASDGKEYADVKVVGRDQLNDIAFLKIQNVKDLKPAKLGDSSKVKVGSKVVAIGNALGQFQNSVTTGVISGLGRPLVAVDGFEAEQLENLFQTDAAINPGNSGGPLVNLNGEVIGINTAIAQGAEGIGFAIPINDAKGLVNTVVAEGKLVRPFLGIQAISLTPDLAIELGIETEQGAYILPRSGIVANGPAAKAGLKARDIITKVNDELITQQNSLQATIAKHKIGEEVTVTFLREGKEQTVAITLEEAPSTN